MLLRNLPKSIRNYANYSGARCLLPLPTYALLPPFCPLQVIHKILSNQFVLAKQERIFPCDLRTSDGNYFQLDSNQ